MDRQERKPEVERREPTPLEPPSDPAKTPPDREEDLTSGSEGSGRTIGLGGPTQSERAKRGKDRP